MRELPILFSTPMVQALLEGRKTMTRRKKGLEDKNKFLNMGYNLRYDSIEDGPDENGYVYFEILDSKGNPTEKYSKAKPQYTKGDLLWVRETWHPKRHSFPIGLKFEYKATAKEDGNPMDEHWKPSIHMPKEAARIWLKVTDVKVERLQDITEEDAIKEGAVCFEKGTDWMEAKYGFQIIWENINGEGSWKLNTWVWVYTFEIISTTGKPLS